VPRPAHPGAVVPGTVLRTLPFGALSFGLLLARDPPSNGGEVRWGPRLGSSVRVLVLAVVEPGGVKPDALVLTQGGGCGWTWSDDAAWQAVQGGSGT